MHRSPVVAGMSVVAGLALAACSTAKPPTTLSAVSPTTATTAAPATTTTMAPTTTAPTVTKPSSVNPVTTSSAPGSVETKHKDGFNAAKQQWVAGAKATSADMGHFWLNAASDLTTGETHDQGTTGYASAVAELKQLAALPDAMQTPAQMAESHNDVAALNTFFGTPGLYA